MTTVMFDSISVAALPVYGDDEAGYVGGYWPTYAGVKARFPTKPVLGIAIAASEDADCLDIENGDATIYQAATWVKRQLARGLWKPCLYTSESNVGALLGQLAQAGIARSQIRLWVAHYTYNAHLCSAADGCPTDADATQWTDRAGACDESLVADGFFLNGPAPAPVIPPKKKVEMSFQIIPIPVGDTRKVAVPLPPANYGLVGDIWVSFSCDAPNFSEAVPAGKTGDGSVPLRVFAHQVAGGGLNSANKAPGAYWYGLVGPANSGLITIDPKNITRAGCAYKIPAGVDEIVVERTDPNEVNPASILLEVYPAP